MTQPSAQQIAFAIFASLPQYIYSGSNEHEISNWWDLSPVDGDGDKPFATEIKIDGKPFTIVVAASEDVSPLDDMRRERSVSFEVEPPE